MAAEIRNSYLRAAENDDKVLGSVSTMRSLYVASASEPSPAPLPPHAGWAAGTGTPGQPRVLRVAQYNMNVLYGATFSPPHETPAAAFALLSSLNADVLFLQEAAQQAFPDLPIYRSGLFASLNPALASARMAELHSLLASSGYTLVQVEGVFNPPLLATRLPLVHTGPSINLDGGQMDPAQETRGARRVLLSLGGGATLAALVTHLHHTEKGHPGLRREEAQALLAHAAAQEALEPAPPALTLCATDFNSVRQRDYSAREWAVIQRSLARAGEPHTDGVVEVLEAAGFACTYDAPGAGAPAFTHWTGATVDFCWLRSSSSSSTQARVAGVHAVHSPISDHLPVVHDIEVTL